MPNVKVDCISDEKGYFKEINIKQTIYEPIEIGNINDFSISIIDKPWYNKQQIQLVNFFGWDSSNINLKERKQILVKSEQPKDFEKFIEVIHILQEFLTFACGQIILPSKVESYIIRKDKSVDLNINPNKLFNKLNNEEIESIKSSNIKLIEKEENRPFHINIFYQISSPLINKISFDELKILFKFTDIKDNSNIVLKKWKNIQESLDSIIEIYLGLYYIPIRNTKELFLSLAQAIEGFHRIYYNKKYFGNSVGNKIKKALRNTLRDEIEKYELKKYEKVLVGKVGRIEEYSFKERLFDLIDIYSIDFPDNFVNEVGKTRDYLTHINPKSEQKKNVLSKKELNDSIEKLKIILTICLLTTLELNPLTIQSIISRKFSQYIR